MENRLTALVQRLPELPLEQEIRDAICAAAEAVQKDEKLMASARRYYDALFLAENAPGRELIQWCAPYADEKLGGSMLFTVLLFARAQSLIDEGKYAFGGKPVDFFAPLLRHFRLNIKRNGSYGFQAAQRFWAYCYLRPVSFELGRLAFEIKDYDYDYAVYRHPETGDEVPMALAGRRFDENGIRSDEGSFETDLSCEGDTVRGYAFGENGRLVFEEKTLVGYECAMKPGDKVISVHMPGNAKLSEEAVTASFDCAKVFFDRYFPQLDYKGFICSSWIMDADLRNVLREDSNILNFQKRFRIPAMVYNDFSLFDSIFGVPKCPIEELVPTNSFQQKVLELIKNGGSLHSGRAYRLRTAEKGGTQ